MRTFKGTWLNKDEWGQCKYNVVEVEVLPHDVKDFWQNAFVGQTRQALAIIFPANSNNHPFYIDNEDGSAWDAIVNGNFGKKTLRRFADCVHGNDVLGESIVAVYNPIHAKHIEKIIQTWSNNFAKAESNFVGKFLDGKPPELERLIHEEGGPMPNMKNITIPKVGKVIVDGSKKKPVKKAKKKNVKGTGNNLAGKDSKRRKKVSPQRKT
jgi:hypothetical protein